MNKGGIIMMHRWDRQNGYAMQNAGCRSVGGAAWGNREWGVGSVEWGVWSVERGAWSMEVGT